MGKINEYINILEKNKITILENKFDYLSSLNLEQQIAASRIDGNFLVLAGPGSGKTHTLLFRVIHLIKSGKDPKEICIITFTRKAADELKRRLKQIDEELEIGFVGTFHSLAAHLGAEGGILNNQYRMIDPEDDNMLLKHVIKNNDIKFKSKIRAKTLIKIFSFSINTLDTIENSMHKLSNEKYLEDIEEILKLHYLYTKIKIDSKYFNYDDLIRMIAFDEHGKSKDNKFNYLMIDEYQDTNNLQIKFIKNLCIPNVMAIGDDFQCIYEFRGANPEIILSFSNDFPNAKMIILTTNYRSTPQIVNAINVIIKDSKFGFHKELKSSIDSGLDVNIVNQEDAKKYSDDILEKITSNLDVKSAIIYRNNNMRDIFEKELILKNIEYVVYGGVRLLDRKHVKDIFSLILVSQNKSDLVSHLRSLSLIDGLGETGSKRVLNGEKLKNNVVMSRVNEMYEIIESNDTIMGMLDKAIKFYFSMEKTLLKSNYTKESISGDFEIIRELAKPYKIFINFINDIILDPVMDKFQKGNKKSNIVLTTIHSCKGMEFDNVYYLYNQSIFNMYSTSTLEEDRRLFYVAISRAKNKLVIYDTFNFERNIKEIAQDFSVDGKTDSTFKIPLFDEKKNNASDGQIFSKNQKLQEKRINKKMSDKKSFKILLLFLLSFLGFFGIAGIQFFYQKKVLLGLLFLFTFGFFFIGTFISCFIYLIKAIKVFYKKV